MEWTVTDDHPTIKIEDTIISGFKEWVQSSKVKCKVSLRLCDPFFWLIQAERDSLRGPVGNYGPAGPAGVTGSQSSYDLINPHIDTRKVAEPKCVIVSIQFNLATEQAEELKTHQLSLTKNHVGETLPTWQLLKLQKELSYPCGVYKRSGFNAAYNAVKAMKPSITEEAFARGTVMPWHSDSDVWDEDLVKLELFHGWKDCMKVFCSSIPVNTGETIVRLELLAPDVNENLEYITGLLSAYIPGGNTI